MRLFENFPQSVRCPICGTNENKKCFLMPIDGTQDENVAECVPVHADCISERLGDFRFNREMGIAYLFAEQQGEQQ
jgi:hypothetical protein